MASPFTSPEEFREVMDRVFRMMSEDPEMGPRLRDADVPQRFEFSDVSTALVWSPPRKDTFVTAHTQADQKGKMK